MIYLILEFCRRFTLPVGVELLIAQNHAGHPLLLPEVEIGRFDASDGGPKCPMRSRAVGAEKHSKIQRSPCMLEGVQVGERVSQSAQTWFDGCFNMGSSNFFCSGKSNILYSYKQMKIKLCLKDSSRSGPCNIARPSNLAEVPISTENKLKLDANKSSSQRQAVEVCWLTNIKSGLTLPFCTVIK